MAYATGACRPGQCLPATILTVTTVRKLAGMIKVGGRLREGAGRAHQFPHRGTGRPLRRRRARREAAGDPDAVRPGVRALLPAGRRHEHTRLRQGVRGVVVDLTLLRGLQAEGTLVTALGGTPVSALAEFALAQGLAGMEFAYALPGSVGGAVWMNARCYEREISDVLEFVDYLDADIGSGTDAPRRMAVQDLAVPAHAGRDPAGGFPACPWKSAADRRL